MENTSTGTNETQNEHTETADAASKQNPARAATKRKPKITRARPPLTEPAAEAGAETEGGGAPTADITSAIQTIEAAATVEEPADYFGSVGEVLVTSDMAALIAEPETFATICTDIRRRVDQLEATVIRQTFEIADRMVAAKRQYEAETGTGRGKRNPSRVTSFVQAAAKEIGRSPAFIQRILTIAQLDPASRSQLEALHRTPSQALLLDLAREADPAKRIAKIIDAVSEPDRKARIEERRRAALGTRRVMINARSAGDAERVEVGGKRLTVQVMSVRIPRAALERALAESADTGEMDVNGVVGTDFDKKLLHEAPEITDAIVTLVVA